MLRLTIEGDIQGWLIILATLRMLYLEGGWGAGSRRPLLLFEFRRWRLLLDPAECAESVRASTVPIMTILWTVQMSGSWGKRRMFKRGMARD
jgi:hypothetical protein